MQNSKIKTKSPLTKDNKSASNTLLTHNLPVLIEEMKNNNVWTNTGYNEMVLFNKPGRKIVLTALQEGCEIKSFQSNESITFHIIEGEMQFLTKKANVLLNKGQLLTLQENIKYKLRIKAETVLLLTIVFGIFQPLTN
ncbi:MAG: hypothetical protein NTZ33_07005 [Bacteroidetes bacterium]|nr:hypothetical protein [Bacteroidota bacterium]